MDSDSNPLQLPQGFNSFPYSQSGWNMDNSQPGTHLWNVPPPNWTGNSYWIPTTPQLPTDLIQSSSLYDANSNVNTLSSEMLGAQTVTNAIANRYYTSNNSHSSYGYRDQPIQGGLGSYSSRKVENEEKKTQREEDQKWVDAFVKNIVKTSSSVAGFASREAGNSLSVGNARILMKKCICLINELKIIHSKLNSIDKSDNSLFNSTACEAVDVKARLEIMLNELNSKDKLIDLRKKMKRIIKKRERLRRQKVFLSEEKKEKEKQNKLQHAKLDFWLQSIRQDYLNSEMEKKMKKEADGILSEVRRKKSEANRTMDLVKSLLKLRAVRKQMAEAKGLYSSTECDEKFSKSVATFETILKDRLSEYGEEERALQVILEEEHQETRDMETKRQQEERDCKENTLRAEVLRSLFGPEIVVSEHDLRFRCWEYLTRSDRDLETLIRVRNTWDSWLSRGDDEINDCGKSSVPIGWIRPSDPTDKVWASIVIHQ